MDNQTELEWIIPKKVMLGFKRVFVCKNPNCHGTNEYIVNDKNYVYNLISTEPENPNL